MSIEIGIIISLITCIIGIVSFIIGQKKTGKDDGMKEVDGKIKEAIADHVRAYHK